MIMIDVKPHDDRPRKDGWCPGEYIVKCRTCKSFFVGDKRSWECADCAYNKPLTVVEMVLKYLEENGYDGIYCSDVPCGCEKSNLNVCESSMATCRAGYKVNYKAEDKCGCDGEGEDHWHIGPKKEAL